MIQKMRRKFIAVAMTAVILVMGAIFVTINFSVNRHAEERIQGYFILALENDGNIEDLGSDLNGLPLDKIAINEVKSFSVMVSKDGAFIEVIQNSENANDSDIINYVQQAMKCGRNEGSVDSYRYKMKALEDGSLIIVFANNRVQVELLNSLLRISYITGGISTMVLFVFIIYLSKFITEPVEIAFEKQKRFITDSSHELLSLVRAEQSDSVFKEFNLSDLMEKVILHFEVIAFENGNMIEFNIEDKVMLNGDEEGVQKVIDVLMENAIKYARDKTVIKANLFVNNGQKVIEIFNEGIGVTNEEKDKLFDKFYRVDDSRQRSTGGYGNGLSIVQYVVKRHKGKITVGSVPNQYILFKVQLP